MTSKQRVREIFNWQISDRAPGDEFAVQSRFNNVTAMIDEYRTLGAY